VREREARAGSEADIVERSAVLCALTMVGGGVVVVVVVRIVDERDSRLDIKG
jgi:hypothetical protein